MWNIVTGACEKTFEGHSDSVIKAEISDDGIRVVSGSLDNTVRVWNIVTGECDKTFTFNGLIKAIKEL